MRLYMNAAAWRGTYVQRKTENLIRHFRRFARQDHCAMECKYG